VRFTRAGSMDVPRGWSSSRHGSGDEQRMRDDVLWRDFVWIVHEHPSEAVQEHEICKAEHTAPARHIIFSDRTHARQRPSKYSEYCGSGTADVPGIARVYEWRALPSLPWRRVGGLSTHRSPVPRPRLQSECHDPHRCRF
jgi:hypothetical protein